MSALVALELERLVASDERYDEARQQAEPAMGRARTRGGRSWVRDDLRER